MVPEDTVAWPTLSGGGYLSDPPPPPPAVLPLERVFVLIRWRVCIVCLSCGQAATSVLEEAKDNKMLSYKEMFLLHEQTTLGRVRHMHTHTHMHMHKLPPPRCTHKQLSLSLSPPLSLPLSLFEQFVLLFSMGLL